MSESVNSREPKPAPTPQAAPAKFYQVIHNVIFSPLVFTVPLGLAANYVFSHTVPSYIALPANTFGAAFPSLALFTLGMSMAEQTSTMDPKTLLGPLLTSVSLIATKCIICPVIMLLVMITFQNDTSLAMLSLVYGCLAAGPSVFFFALEYNVCQKYAALLVVLGTFLFAPLVYIAANVVCMVLLGYDHVMQQVEQVLFTMAVIGATASVWTLVTCITRKPQSDRVHFNDHARLENCLVASLALSLAAAAISGLLCLCKLQYPYSFLRYVFGYGGHLAAHIFAAIITFAEVLCTQNGPDWTLRRLPLIQLLGWALTAMFVIVPPLSSQTPATCTDPYCLRRCWFPYKDPQYAISISVKAICAVIVILCVSLLLQVQMAGLRAKGLPANWSNLQLSALWWPGDDDEDDDLADGAGSPYEMSIARAFGAAWGTSRDPEGLLDSLHGRRQSSPVPVPIVAREQPDILGLYMPDLTPAVAVLLYDRDGVVVDAEEPDVDLSIAGTSDFASRGFYGASTADMLANFSQDFMFATDDDEDLPAGRLELVVDDNPATIPPAGDVRNVQPTTSDAPTVAEPPCGDADVDTSSARLAALLTTLDDHDLSFGRGFPNVASVTSLSNIPEEPERPSSSRSRSTTGGAEVVPPGATTSAPEPGPSIRRGSSTALPAPASASEAGQSHRRSISVFSPYGSPFTSFVLEASSSGPWPDPNQPEPTLTRRPSGPWPDLNQPEPTHSRRSSALTDAPAPADVAVPPRPPRPSQGRQSSPLSTMSGTSLPGTLPRSVSRRSSSMRSQRSQISVIPKSASALSVVGSTRLGLGSRSGSIISWKQRTSVENQNYLLMFCLFALICMIIDITITATPSFREGNSKSTLSGLLLLLATVISYGQGAVLFLAFGFTDGLLRPLVALREWWESASFTYPEVPTWTRPHDASTPLDEEEVVDDMDDLLYLSRRGSSGTASYMHANEFRENSAIP